MEGRKGAPVYEWLDVTYTNRELNIQGCCNLIYAILKPMFKRAEKGDWVALGYILSEDAECWGALICKDGVSWRRYVEEWLRDVLMDKQN